jgi:hypothetical protein
VVYCTLDILKECLTFMYLTLRNEISEKYDQVREENSRGGTFVTSLCNKNLYFILIDRAMSFFIIGKLVLSAQPHLRPAWGGAKK